MRMTVRNQPQAVADRLLDAAQKTIINEEAPFFFGIGDDCQLAKVVVGQLRERGWRVTAAESDWRDVPEYNLLGTWCLQCL
ncbi:MAG: hypothetical protein ACLSH6_09960 [Limosilactobacillus pontis]